MIDIKSIATKLLNKYNITIFIYCIIGIITAIIIFGVIYYFIKKIKSNIENFQSENDTVILQGPEYSLQFKQVYIDNKILGTFLQSGTYNNYNFFGNKDIFTNFTTIIEKINTNYSALLDNYSLFSIITADSFIGYCETTNAGNKCYYTLKTDIDIGDYVILSDYIIDEISYGYNQFNPSLGFNTNTQFLAVNKMYVDMVIPQYKMQCNSINISSAADNIAIKTAIPGYFDITATNFIGKSFLDYDESTGNPEVFKKFNTSHTSIYKLNQLFYDIVQTNYVTTIPDSFEINNLNNYKYISINSTRNTSLLYLTYDILKIDTSQNILDCLSIDQTLPRLKVLPVQIPLPNNTTGIVYIIPPGVNNIFSDLWVIGIESINLTNTPIKLFRQHELLTNANDIVKKGGIHNLGYPFFVFNTDRFNINDYIRQQLPSTFGFDFTNKKIYHLSDFNNYDTINNIETKSVFDDINYKYPGTSNGFKIYIGNYTYLNNNLIITSRINGELNNNGAINIAWNTSGLQCLIPINYIDGINTNIKLIVIDDMQFIINSAVKWTQTNGNVTTDYIWCIIKIFGINTTNFILSSEKQSITIPQTTQKIKITTPTVYIPPNIEVIPLPFTEDVIATTTTLPATTTTLPASTTTLPATTTTLPATTTTLPATTTTLPATTTTQLKYITSAAYDEIIQKYRGIPIHNMSISRLSYDNDSTIIKHHPSTTKAKLKILPDDILNYYGNIIIDKEGIEIIKKNKYLDDLLK